MTDAQTFADNVGMGDREQQFLAVAAEVVSEVGDILRESNERAERIERERERTKLFVDFYRGAASAAAVRRNSPQELVEELTYRSYAHNRNLAPHIKPETWVKAYGDSVPEMEARYLRERG